MQLQAKLFQVNGIKCPEDSNFWYEMFLTHQLIKGAHPTQHLFWFLDRFHADLHGGVVSPWSALYTWKSREQDRNVCYHVCKRDTKLPDRACNLSLLKLKKKVTVLKVIQGITEIFETVESAKPNKTHGFITGVRRQEQEMWPCQMWPLNTVGCSWACHHGHITDIPSCCHISPTPTIGILQPLHPGDVSSSPGTITHPWKGSQGTQVS